jgi:hypothetical protein
VKSYTLGWTGDEREKVCGFVGYFQLFAPPVETVAFLALLFFGLVNLYVFHRFNMKSSCFLPLSRGSYSLGLSDRRLARRVLFLEGRLRKDFL